LLGKLLLHCPTYQHPCWHQLRALNLKIYSHWILLTYLFQLV